MNVKKLFGGVLLLALVTGVVLPSSVLAQGGSTFGGDVDGPLLGAETDSGAPSVFQQAINIFTGGTPGTGSTPNIGVPGVSSLQTVFDFVTGGNSVQTGQGGGGSANTNSVQTGTTGSDTGGGGFGGGGIVDSTLDTGADLVGGFLNMLGAIGNALEDNPVVNLVGDAVGVLLNAGEAVVNEAVGIGIGVSGEVFDTTDMGEPAGVDALSSGSQGGGSAYGGGGVIQSGQTIQFANGQNLTLSQGATATVNPNGSVTINLANGHTLVITSEGYTTEFNEQGQATNSNDPSVNPGNWNNGAGNSSGPSIPGASIGTVGNPFSTGSSDGDQDTPPTPWPFDYDPSSTNNNPAGEGAMEN